MGYILLMYEQIQSHHFGSFFFLFSLKLRYCNRHQSHTTQITQRVCSFFLMVFQIVVHVLASAGCSTVNLMSKDRTRHARHILISLVLWSIYQFSRGGNELIQTKQNAPPSLKRNLMINSYVELEPNSLLLLFILATMNCLTLFIPTFQLKLPLHHKPLLLYQCIAL